LENKMKVFNGTFFSIVSRDPMILIHDPTMEHRMDHLLPPEPICRWIYYSFTSSREYILESDAMMRATRPHDTIIHMPNDQATVAEDYPDSVNVSWISLHCLLAENVFRLHPLHDIEFDAVIVAKASRFKQIELAEKVRNLGILSTGGTDRELYEAELKALMPHAEFFNKDGKNFKHDKVAKIMAKGAVGLCLSSAEGAMRVSQECQLVGRPVVSVPSIGGRDVFLDPETSVIVEPRPWLIAKAVKAMAEKRIPPHFVRRKIMEKIVTHRRELMRLGQQFWIEKGKAEDFAPTLTSAIGSLRWLKDERIIPLLQSPLSQSR
jgi:glycosyltransferase involved in cell wall biosynthesis